MPNVRDYVAQADQHIVTLKALISEQEALIDLLSADEQPTHLAQTLLGTMKDTLRLFERHRELMLTPDEKTAQALPDEQS
jgi:hypothetical protein